MLLGGSLVAMRSPRIGSIYMGSCIGGKVIWFNFFFAQSENYTSALHDFIS